MSHTFICFDIIVPGFLHYSMALVITQDLYFTNPVKPNEIEARKYIFQGCLIDLLTYKSEYEKDNQAVHSTVIMVNREPMKSSSSLVFISPCTFK